MYDEARLNENIVERVRVTRQSLKMNLRQYKLHNKKYINSLYIRGTHLWGKLSRETQLLQSKYEFKAKLYSIYDDKYLDKYLYDS